MILVDLQSEKFGAPHCCAPYPRSASTTPTARDDRRCAPSTPVAAAPPGTDAPTRSPSTLPAHQRLCRRHRIWLGGACQIDLATAPEVVHAHHRAVRLAHRYGVLRLLHVEITTRQQISAACYPDAVQQRIDKITASNPGLIFEQPDLIEAATYPEVISSAARALSKTS